ncbi:MAG TPA: hypothetical protein VG900_18235, partial [Hyphomicrobiaceae bacterium]|nr:hypothetical protein [Hyphomicrobiaceae bacterium]
VRAPASPSCRIDAAKAPSIVVDRYDTCEQFEDDMAAALSIYRSAELFRCHSGGLHALADCRVWQL